MAYQVRNLRNGLATLTDDIGDPVLKIVTVELETGKFAQEACMPIEDARRFAKLDRLAEALAGVLR